MFDENVILTGEPIKNGDKDPRKIYVGYFLSQLNHIFQYGLIEEDKFVNSDKSNDIERNGYTPPTDRIDFLSTEFYSYYGCVSDQLIPKDYRSPPILLESLIRKYQTLKEADISELNRLLEDLDEYYLDKESINRDLQIVLARGVRFGARLCKGEVEKLSALELTEQDLQQQDQKQQEQQEQEQQRHLLRDHIIFFIVAADLLKEGAVSSEQ